MISDALYSRFYGERGNPKYNGTLAFYSLLRRHAHSGSHVLNIGAGPATGDKIRTLKGEVAQVVGADIDPVVLTNNELDAAAIIEGGRLPFADQTFDLAFSDYVLEHVEEPVSFLGEVHRVLKPGARFFFRTPNIYHYTALISRATPYWFHKIVANQVRGVPDDAHDPYPTFYRLNTRRAIIRAAKEVGFNEIQLQLIEAEPSYLMFHAIPFLVGVAYERTVNCTDVFAGFRANIFGQLIK